MSWKGGSSATRTLEPLPPAGCATPHSNECRLPAFRWGLVLCVEPNITVEENIFQWGTLGWT